VRRGAAAALGLAAFASAHGPAAAQTYEVLHAFRSNVGAAVSAPVDGGDGSLYGVTPQGGAINSGVVYRLTPDGAGGFVRTDLYDFSVAYSANPFAFSVADGAGALEPLTPMPDGYLYGVTFQGGVAACELWGGCGTVFRVDRRGELTSLHSFTFLDGILPSGPLLPLTSGNLMGVAAEGGASGYGVVYIISPEGGYRIAHSFSIPDGSDLQGTLVLTPDGSVYGVARQGGSTGEGVLYRIDPTGVFQIVHEFGGDVRMPVGGLVRASDGLLYGVCDFAASNANDGGIYRSDLSGNVSLVHAFDISEGTLPAGALAVGADGLLYGTMQQGGDHNLGTLFRVSTSGDFQLLASFDGTNGAHPRHALTLLSDGAVWGATPEGTPGGMGGLFRVDASGSITSTYTFWREEGSGSAVDLVQTPDGQFVGTTDGGGRYDKGYVFRVDAVGGFEILHHFGGADGATPRSGLLLATDGSLYGTTFEGGAFGLGTIYSIDGSGSFASLFNFSGGNGLNPVARLTEAGNGQFYGTTQGGGLTGAGTAFRFEPPQNLTQLHSFVLPDGTSPIAPLVAASDGFFYGTAESAGGGASYGTVFRVDPQGGFLKIHDFGFDDGASPHDGMIQASDGMLYGTTESGGAAAGTLYRLDPSTGSLTTVHNFAPDDGVFPESGVLESPDGKLYGTTSYGGIAGAGTVYSIEKSGDAYSTVWDFAYGLGGAPSSRVILATDGDLYGTAGVVYRLSLANRLPQITSLSPSSGRAEGGTTLSVIGTRFRLISSLQIGGALAIAADMLDAQTVAAVAPARPAASLTDVFVTFIDGTHAILENAWMADFHDVQSAHPFHDDVEAIFRAGVTTGCGGGNYCPTSPVRRDQMAVFLLKSEHGSGYTPPACAGVFADVPCPSAFADWVEQLAAEGVTSGCGGGDYCPDQSVTRAQMAVFLLKTSQGSSYTPPAATGIFGDVPVGSFAADFIEDLYNRGITGGCQASPLLYCPGNIVLRQQMATFLVRTFF